MQKIEAEKNQKKVLTMIKRIWYYKKALEREENKRESVRTLKIKQHKI